MSADKKVSEMSQDTNSRDKDSGATNPSLVDRTTEIVQTYLTKGDIDAERLPDLIERIGGALRSVRDGSPAAVGVGPAARSQDEAARPAARPQDEVARPATPVAESMRAGESTPVAEPAPEVTESRPAPEQVARSPRTETSGAGERPEWMPEGTFGAQRPPWDPAVPIEDSYSDDYIWCLEDGRRMQMLKRHLKTKYGMSEDQYKRKWGLPSKYPMTAKNYRLIRRQLAQRTGFQPIPQADEQADEAQATEAQATEKVAAAGGGGGAAAQGASATTAKSGSGARAKAGSTASGTGGSSAKAGGKATGTKATGAKAANTKAANTKAGGTKSATGGKSAAGAKPETGTKASGTKASSTTKAGGSKASGSKAGGSTASGGKSSGGKGGAKSSGKSRAA